MWQPSLEFWFEFASPYSYVAAMQIEELCKTSGVALTWVPFQLGPIFAQQGWNTSHFNLNPWRGTYMWRDMERLTAISALPWRRPTEFPRKSVLASRIAAAHADKPWIGRYVRGIFIANFGNDSSIEDRDVVMAVLRDAGADPDNAIAIAVEAPLRSRLRANTERALSLGIFGAPNCVVDGELFWGEETLQDAVAWALACTQSNKARIS